MAYDNMNTLPENNTKLTFITSHTNSLNQEKGFIH